MTKTKYLLVLFCASVVTTISLTISRQQCKRENRERISDLHRQNQEQAYWLGGVLRAERTFDTINRIRTGPQIVATSELDRISINLRQVEDAAARNIAAWLDSTACEFPDCSDIAMMRENVGLSHPIYLYYKERDEKWPDSAFYGKHEYVSTARMLKEILGPNAPKPEEPSLLRFRQVPTSVTRPVPVDDIRKTMRGVAQKVHRIRLSDVSFPEAVRDFAAMVPPNTVIEEWQYTNATTTMFFWFGATNQLPRDTCHIIGKAFRDHESVNN
jgi:hypothetical protein